MGDRLPNETDKAWQAFQDFREMGTARSVTELARQYKEEKVKKRNVPTESYKTLKNWAFDNNWNERIKAWDAEEEKRRLEHLSKSKRDKWEKEVEDYRDRNKRFGAAAFQTAIQALNEASIAITYNPEIKGKDGKPLPKPKLTVDQATRLLGVLPRLVDSSQSTEGTALGITQLLEEMNGESK